MRLLLFHKQGSEKNSQTRVTYISNDYTNDSLSSKHRTNRKQRKHRKTTKISFPKEWVEKADLNKSRIEQNNDHILLTHKIQFCSSFKITDKLTKYL